MNNRMRVTIDGNEYHAELEGTSIAREIAGMLPFESEFSRFGGNEYNARLPSKPKSECETTSNCIRDGIYFFRGWNTFCILFRDVDISPYTVVPLGRFIDSVSDMLE